MCMANPVDHVANLLNVSTTPTNLIFQIEPNK